MKSFVSNISFLLDLQYQCTLNGQEYDLTIIDNAGSDQYTINHIDLENSDAYILVYAIDDRQRSVIFDKFIESSTKNILVFIWFRKFERKFYQQVQLQSKDIIC